MQLNNKKIENNETQRQSNIELLRIVAMILIVAHHFAVHSGFNFPTNSLSINRLWIQFIQIGGKIGVNIFVLISGYFLISFTTFNLCKLIKLWTQIFFYSSTIFVIFVITKIVPFKIKDLIIHFAPITFCQWWFASTYILLYILSPYINKLLRSFNKQQYINFLTLLFLLWCIIPTLTGQTFESNNLLWFIFLYSLAGYYNLFNLKINLSSTILICISIICTFLTFLSVIVLDILGTKIPILAEKATFFYGANKFPILLISIFLFIGFSKLNIGYIKFINLFSSATFGVYLIHDNVYIRIFLWKSLFQNYSYSNSNILIFYSLFVITLVFIGCTIIELLRIYFFEKKYIQIIHKLANYINDKKFSIH